MSTLIERTAQLLAHRACCGSEHDPQNGKLHGYCVVCGVPWPCEYAGEPPEHKPQDTAIDWTERAARVAEELLRTNLASCTPIRNESGEGIQHAAWMATELTKREMSPTKACRWLGYIQAVAISYGLSTLAKEKQRNLTSRANQ